MNNSEIPPYDAFCSKFWYVNSWKRTIQKIKKYLVADWRLKKHYLKWSSLNHRLQEKKTANICLIYGIVRISALLKTFYAGTTTKSLSQHRKQCKKMLAFYHKKGIDMLMLGFTPPNLANICLHTSTSANFNPFTETDKDLLQKIREDMVDDPSNVYTSKAVIDKTFTRNSRTKCNSNVGIDASQLCTSSMCQPMPTRLYTRWEYNTESNTFKPQQNISRNFEKMVMSCFQNKDLTVKL